MRYLILCLSLLGLLIGPATYAAETKQSRQAADKLMQTLDIEKKVNGAVQLYLALMPQSTPEQSSRAQVLREKAPTAGPRFRTAVSRAAARSYTAPELLDLDKYFQSDEGQRFVTTILGRALMGVGKGGVKPGDLIKPEDFASQPALAGAAIKYPAFEQEARGELAREFAGELALLAAR